CHIFQCHCNSEWSLIKLLEDTCIVGCCPTCSLCQIQRDINRRKQMGIF
uniref:Uncharacterized protein n=1 Tax=Pseudonaja textilis TaxID=8673 RepID=A0A670Z4T3_PSETE